MLAFPLLSACAPGHIEWPTGDDLLRTALFETEDEGGYEHTVLLLSTAQVPCVIDAGDVAEVEQAQYVAVAGVCREGARHVVLDLYRESTERAEGDYPGSTRADEDQTSNTLTRWVSGWYVGIDEAELADQSGFEQGYHPTVSTYWPEIGSGGDVDVHHGDATELRGTFGFPDAHISGDFRAEACDRDGALLFDLMTTEQSAELFCD